MNERASDDDSRKSLGHTHTGRVVSVSRERETFTERRRPIVAIYGHY